MSPISVTDEYTKIKLPRHLTGPQYSPPLLLHPTSVITVRHTHHSTSTVGSLKTEALCCHSVSRVLYTQTAQPPCQRHTYGLPQDRHFGDTWVLQTGVRSYYFPWSLHFPLSIKGEKKSFERRGGDRRTRSGRQAQPCGARREPAGHEGGRPTR